MWVLYDKNEDCYVSGVFLCFALWKAQSANDAMEFSSKADAKNFIAELKGKGFETDGRLIAMRKN